MYRNLLKTSFLVLSFLISNAAPAQQSQLADSVRFLTPVTDQMLRNPPASDWLMWRRTYDSWGYSPLDQINKRNIGSLQLAWAWTQELGNQEAAPLVHDGIMYLAQSNNVVHALDAKTGNLIWEYRHPVPKLQGS